jgi:ATP-dependent helicase HrpB
MVPLPIDAHVPRVLDALTRARALVLVAEPGAGKTSRVPPAIVTTRGLLHADHSNVVLLQPRRVAARAAAERIAEERGWQLGREVGYHVRFDRKLSRDTRLRVITEGILTRQLLEDPFLSGTGAVVLDEFHERSIHVDLAVALLREVRSSVRPDLILVVMSATLEAEPVAKFLGDCPIVRVEGKTYPVEVSHAARLGARTDDLVTQEVERIGRSEQPGDVLVFLPGAAEIRDMIHRLGALAFSQSIALLPLHGSLPSVEQTRALRPDPQGRRKVICATNIAETSLTIDGVRFVIDTGQARVAGYDARRGLDRLELKRISKASAVQRAGRAGRTAPGQCVRLWSEREFHESPDFELPEIQRVDLCATVLALHAWGYPDPRRFPWYAPPPEQTIVAAERLLAMLGALDAPSNGKITDVGRRLLPLPVHPRLGRLLVAAVDQGMLEAGAALAAVLSEKDFVLDEARAPSARGSSDVLLRAQMLVDARAPKQQAIDLAAMNQVVRVRDELIRVAEMIDAGTRGQHAGEDALLKLVLLAYPDRVARRRAPGAPGAVMVGGGGVRLDRESVVHDWEFFVAADARQDARNPSAEARVRLASGIRVEWLHELFAKSIRRERRAVFDQPGGRVVGISTVSYHDLTLREERDAAVDVQLAADVLAEAVRPIATQVLSRNPPATALLARVRFLRRHMPEHAWPSWDEAKLADVLAEACAGKRSIDELARADLAASLRARLPFALTRLLDQHAPSELRVPSGRSISIGYPTGEGPATMSVRLQELFGWTETPRLAAGRVPLVLHLLGPNFRPVQVTDDLRSFWTSTYPQVRKDLRVRYPKHAWPEDPFTAPPEAKGFRRG